MSSAMHLMLSLQNVKLTLLTAYTSFATCFMLSLRGVQKLQPACILAKAQGPPVGGSGKPSFVSADTSFTLNAKLEGCGAYIG